VSLSVSLATDLIKMIAAAYERVRTIAAAVASLTNQTSAAMVHGGKDEWEV
jgi:hypothetical protein